jgi:hypothetical protein
LTDVKQNERRCYHLFFLLHDNPELRLYMLSAKKTKQKKPLREGKREEGDDKRRWRDGRERLSWLCGQENKMGFGYYPNNSPFFVHYSTMVCGCM